MRSRQRPLTYAGQTGIEPALAACYATASRCSASGTIIATPVHHWSGTSSRPSLRLATGPAGDPPGGWRIA